MTELAPKEFELVERIKRFGEAPQGQFSEYEWNIVHELANRGVCLIRHHGRRVYATLPNISQGKERQ